MTVRKIQALGLTRWSYPGRAGGFRRSVKDLTELRARLYAPGRLAHRVFLLKHLVLPCLRAQTDQDFTQILLMGDQLPQPCRDAVLDLIRDIPQIVPVFRPEGEPFEEICREVMAQYIDPSCDVTAQFRLDDDDAVGVNFVDEARARFDNLHPVFEQEGRMGLDFTRGFILQSSKDSLDIRPVSMRFWAPGMMVFQRPDSPKALLDFHHLQLWHHMPVLTWKKAPMFIRGAHHDNDSNLETFARRSQSFDFNPPNANRYFRNKFAIDLRNMKQVWSEQSAGFFEPSDNKTGTADGGPVAA